MAAPAAQRTRSARPSVATAEQLLGAAVHEITLVTGTVVRVRIPDLVAMIAADALPDHLRNVATIAAVEGVSMAFGIETPEQNGNGELSATELREAQIRSAMAPEKLNQIYELYAHVVSGMLVEPELSPQQVRLLDSRDFDVLSDIAWRRRDTDARGVRLGVVPLSDFATFRKHHKCAQGCKACVEVVAELSTRGVDGV